jgi:hypothetical protein
MTVTSQSDGAAERVGTLGATDGELQPQAAVTPRTRRRPSVLSGPGIGPDAKTGPAAAGPDTSGPDTAGRPAGGAGRGAARGAVTGSAVPGSARTRQHARRVSGPAAGAHHPGRAVARPSAEAPPAVAAAVSSSVAAGQMPSTEFRPPSTEVRPPSAGSGDEVAADERWSREWLGQRRRQHRARVGVATGLALAALLTVLALLTARSPTNTGPQTTSIVLTPAPAVGTAGLVPAAQPPPSAPGTAGATTP